LIKAVLFDMDGVLYDSMKNHAVAWVQSMQKFGINMTADDAYATEGARGVDTIRYMVRQQQGREISEAEAQAMYDEKSRIFHSMPESPIMPGILSLMEQIAADGISIGVLRALDKNRLLIAFCMILAILFRRSISPRRTMLSVASRILIHTLSD
jgi:beta-phosphoglucomutase-like phosphatase (HAD superfamily)